MNSHTNPLMKPLALAAVLVLAPLAGCDDNTAPAPSSAPTTVPMPKTEEASRRALEARERQDQNVDRDREELKQMIGGAGSTPPGPAATRNAAPATRPAGEAGTVRRGVLGGD